jgi:hypothetical protein
MGGYEYRIQASAIPDGTEEIHVMANDEIIRVVPVVTEESGATSITARMCMIVSVVMVIGALVVV